MLVENNNSDCINIVLIYTCNYVFSFYNICKSRFSGITAKMLENVTTTLPDVQKHLVDLLPADAILLGHSLEFDLKALKVG